MDDKHTTPNGINIALLKQGQEQILKKLDNMSTAHQALGKQIIEVAVKQATCEAGLKERMEAVESKGASTAHDVKTLENRIYGLAAGNTVLSGVFAILAGIFGR